MARLHRPVVLVGMMGAGKTAVGRELALQLGVPFSDSDAEIERAAAMTVTEIFARDGEAFFRDREADLRRELGNAIVRGKADLSMYIEGLEEGRVQQLNRELFDRYVRELGAAAEANGLSTENLLGEVLRLPDVMQPLRPEVSDDDWPVILGIANEAMDAFLAFRKSEGEQLANDLRSRVNHIHVLLEQVVPLEPERIATVRQRLEERLAELSQQFEMDRGRVEQELVFFIEKYDVTEEKVRLAAHCRYFIETMETDPHAGRKLSFIAQEMGREINTLGPKANHAEIQKLVVQLNDELEKEKEQVLNVL
jgi:uncharacterized protein (TIGR00255 family)